MRVFSKALVGVLASLLLASCGGGGGSTNNTAFSPEGFVVRVTSGSASTTPFSLVGLTASVTGSNGASVPDGTTVSLQVSPPGVGLISSVTTSNPTQPIPLGETITATTSGGLVNFRFHSRAVGTATLSASASSVVNGSPSVGRTTVAVNAGPPQDNRLTLLVQTPTLPVNPNLSANESVFIGSPYIAEVTLVQRRLDGSLVAQGPTGGTANGSEFCNGGVGNGAAVGSGLNSLALWLPAEGIEETTDPVSGLPVFNIRLCRSVSLGINSGRSVFYVAALTEQGTATVAGSGIDPQTGEDLQALVEIRVTNGAPQLPGTVVIRADSSPIYISTVNGPRSKQVEIDVRDGAGTRVPNPPVGIDNIRLEIVGGGVGGERLRGVNGAGSVVQGDSITLRSANGIANATFESGTRSGPVTLRATSDRADNNVSNGIQDAVISTRQINISDGVLFGLKIQTQTISAPISTSVAGPAPGNSLPSSTYRILVTAKGVDRIGTAVPANTEIRFGLIDEPQVGNLFTMANTDGNPQENGVAFTGSGRFVTNAAGPGDTLLVIGENGTDDRDLESARIVASVVSETQLTVTQPFNPNDVTGTSIDRGSIYPFVVGRARDGTISAQGVTNSEGIASAVVTFPANRLGKRVYIWAQGNGAPVNGRPRLVSDVDQISFAGSGPGLLTATPSSVIANRPTLVTVCLRDAAENPVPNANINFAFSNGAVGSVDGISGSGRTPATGADGCVAVNVLANRIPGTSGETTLTFSIPGADTEVDVTIVNLGTPALTIGPNPALAFALPPGVTSLTTNVVACVNDSGGPLPNVLISGTCTVPAPSAALPPAPGVVVANVPQQTNIDGCAVIPLTYSNMIVQNGANPEVRTSTCTFTAVGGLSATVNLIGTRRCNDGLLPAIPGCPP